MTITVRTVVCTATFRGSPLSNILQARGSVTVDGGWPSCSVFVPDLPSYTSTPADTLVVTGGAGTNAVRFTGVVRRFRPSGYPRGIEMVGMGTLGYADEWAPDQDILFDDVFPNGATDVQIIQHALDNVPQLGSGSYSSGFLAGRGSNILGVLATGAPEAFDWKAGVTAWSRIKEIDRATLYRTYQDRQGVIRRVKMIGHPNTTNDFTLAAGDVLEGIIGSADTERTKNAVRVLGHNFGKDQALGVAYGSFGSYDGSIAAQRFQEDFSSDMIEDGNDIDGGALLNTGLNAGNLAAELLPDVLKEFKEATVPSWRDDIHGPGLTCLLDTLGLIAIGEPMWVQKYSWEITDGWYTTYELSGGGVAQTYTSPTV